MDVFVNRMPRYEILSPDAIAVLDKGWRRIVSEVGVQFAKPEAVALFIAEMTQRYRVRGMAYDRWRINDLLREFDRIGLQAYEDGEKAGDGLLQFVQQFVNNRVQPDVHAFALRQFGRFSFRTHVESHHNRV